MRAEAEASETTTLQQGVGGVHCRVAQAVSVCLTLGPPNISTDTHARTNRVVKYFPWDRYCH